MRVADRTGQFSATQGPLTLLQPDFVVQLPEYIQNTLDASNAAAVRISKSSAIRAFRTIDYAKTGPFLPMPRMNSVGNLRGMVVSKPLRTVFNISTDIAQKFAKYDSALGMAGIVVELSKDSSKLWAISNSSLPEPEKWRQSLLITSTAILRSVTGLVPASSHLVAKSLEGYIEVGGYLTGGQRRADEWVGYIRQGDVLVQTGYDKLFSADFIQHVGDSAANVIFAYISFK